MNSESSSPISLSALPQAVPESSLNLQVRLKSEGGRLLLLLPPEVEPSSTAPTWTDIWQQFKHRLNAGERFWQPNTSVHLIARDRLLDVRQLQSIDDALNDVQLRLKRVYTSRRQTAVAAATTGLSVEQQPSVSQLAPATETSQTLEEPLYLQTTVRSGMDLRHPGSIIIFGDVNPGSTITADGDILVWGYLRGVAHAGASGNNRCVIMALRLEPTQLRIGDMVARAPETPPNEYQPEVVYVATDGIRIAKAADFSKLRLQN
ncbi:septum site-determining protein MinC [Leptolyngbya sp. AN02str]|uniref:septum site-determining protein MinC n=1 Tax=Leptolyngbya sp. AN02str TaxID=3423363 RepID=UPI003D31CB1C